MSTAPRSGLTRRSLITGGGLLAGSALLAACDTTPAVATKPPTTTSAVTLTDQRGKTIRLSGPARRIVTMPFPAAAMLVAVDQSADHLIGMHSASWSAMRSGILGEFFPTTLAIRHDVADGNFIPNVESVLSLRPDLVVQWSDRGSELTAPLESAGLTVLGLTYGTQQDLTTWITAFGAALGKPQRAQALNAYAAQALAEMTSLGRSTTGRAPTVLYVNRFIGGLKVAGAASYNDFYIKLVGGLNPATGAHGVAGKGMVGVDPEQVLAWDPDIILLGNFDAAMPSDLYHGQLWRGLSAVKNRRVYKVPLGGYRWDPPSHESPLMWRWLRMLAFPQGTPFDLRGQVTSSYQEFYGRAPTITQLDTILWTSANDASAHYQQFHAT